MAYTEWIKIFDLTAVCKLSKPWNAGWWRKL